MAAIASADALVNRMTGGNSGLPELMFFQKEPYIQGVLMVWGSEQMLSTWRFDGIPCIGAIPTAAAVPTSATAGAIPFTNPSGGREKWLTQADAVINALNETIPIMFLYDRLLHCGGLSGTVTTAQTVGGAITRNTGGVGNQIWLEQYTKLGNTLATATASYTNQAGTAGRTTGFTRVGGSSEPQYNGDSVMAPMPLQAGDTGVRSVQSVTLSGSTGAAGNFGITIARPLIAISGARNASSDALSPFGGIPRIDADACLSMMMLCGPTEAGVMAMLSTVEA